MCCINCMKRMYMYQYKIHIYKYITNSVIFSYIITSSHIFIYHACSYQLKDLRSKKKVLKKTCCINCTKRGTSISTKYIKYMYKKDVLVQGTRNVLIVNGICNCKYLHKDIFSCLFYTSTKSWRCYIFTSVCLSVCQCVCVCVCL